jgi:hypothetical protein
MTSCLVEATIAKHKDKVALPEASAEDLVPTPYLSPRLIGHKALTGQA